MKALDLLQQLSALGVILTPHPDGTVHCRAPKGVLTAELVDAIREHKRVLLALLSEPMPAADPVQPTAPTLPAPLTPHYPCVVCGSTDRWENRGIWRCRRC